MKLVWLGLAALIAAPASANPPAPADHGEVVEIGADRTERMTVPVRIAGAGPYPFVIDTGAERTVISRELARTLGLSQGRTATMHSMSGIDRVATVVIPTLQVSSNIVTNIHAPALERTHLGAAGMLGIDSLQEHRVLLDFKAGTMTVSPASAPERRWDRDTIVVTARRKAGQLIVTNATANGRRVSVIVDTGAQMSVGNNALRRVLTRARGESGTVEMISVVGDKVEADYMSVRTLKLGSLELRDMPIAFADVQPFKKVGLDKKPALLLGMDALRLFERVSVDFASKRVRFLLPDEAGRPTDTMLAALER